VPLSFRELARFDLGVFRLRLLPPVVSSSNGLEFGFSKDFGCSELENGFIEFAGFDDSDPEELTMLEGLLAMFVNDLADLEITSPNPPIDVAYAKTPVVTAINPYAITGTPYICTFVKSDIINLYN